MERTPENLWDLPGLSTWNEQGGIDADGQHFTWEQVSQDPGLRAVASGQTNTIYKSKNGGYTANLVEADLNPTISLDKKTGNVKIDAPSMYFQSESYQQKIKPMLEAISQNYKLNPDYKYALLNDDKNTKTSEDWVNEISKELKAWVEDAVVNEDVKRQIFERDGVKLNDEQLVKMGAVALERQENGEIVKVKDTDTQSLPERIRDLKAFEKLTGWDESNHQVTYKDIMEVWDREKTSDEDIIEVFNEVEKYFKEGDFSDADEYAEMVAFSQFINGRDPNVGFWRGAMDIVSNIGFAVITGATEFDMRVLDFVEGSMNVAGSFGAGVATGDFSKPATGELNFVRDYLRPELEDMVKAHQTNSMRLNDAGAAVYGITHTLTPLVMQLSIGNALGRAAADGVASATASMIAKTGEAGLVGASQGVTAQQIATATFNGTNFLLRTAKANVANGMVVSAINTLRNYEKAGRAIMTVADLGAQTIVDVVMTDSKLFRQFLEGDGTDEEKAYILEQIAQNVAGWGIANVSIKGIQAIGKSSVGRVGNAVLAPKISWLKSRVGALADGIKVNLMHGGEVNWASNKAKKLSELAAAEPDSVRLANRASKAERQAQELQLRRLVRKAEYNISELDGPFKGASSWDDIVKRADDIKKEMVDQIAAANRLADLTYMSDVSSRTGRFYIDDPLLKQARDDYISGLTKVLKLEDANKLARTGSAIDLGGGSFIRSMSKQTNEYVNALYRYRQATIFEKLIKDGDTLRGIAKEKEHYAKVIADFQKNYSSELVEAANELEMLARKFSARTQDLRVAERVLDADVLRSRRESEFFAEGYLRQQRVNEWERYQKRGGELHIAELRDDQHLRWGSTDEFQDLSFVLFDDVNQVARQSIRREQIEILKDLGEKVDVVVDGDQVKMVKTIEPIKNKAIKDIEHNTKSFVKDFDDSVFNEVFSYKEAKSAILTAQDAAISAGAKVSKATVTVPEIGSRKLKSLINDPNVFDDTVIDALVETKFNKPFIELNEIEFNEFLDKASAQSKKIVRDAIRDNNIFDSQYGELTKKDLPKIRTSDYTAATGLKYKDAPSWLKPYLSEKQGEAMDLIRDRLGNGSWVYQYGTVNDAGNSWDEISGLYENIITKSSRGNVLDWENFEYFVKNGSPENVYEMQQKLNRSLVVNNYDNIQDMENGFVKQVAQDYVKDKAVFDAETLYAENIEKLVGIKEQADLPNMATDLNKQMDDAIDAIIANNRSNEKVYKALSTLDDSDDIVEYATLKSLTEKGNLKEVKQKFRSKAVKEYNQILTANNKVIKDGEEIAKLDGKQINRMANEWADQSVDWFEERVMQRYGEASSRLAQQGSDIVDYDDLFGKISEINSEITGASKTPDIVKTYNAYGSEEYVRLSPTVADLFTTRPRAIRRGPFGKVQQTFVRAFRAGTTGGIVPGSLIRQGFRDTGNALVMGDAWRSNAAVERVLAESFGDTIAEYMEREMPDVWRTLLKQADDTGENINTLLARREMARGRANVEAELESNLYQFVRNERITRNADGIYDESVWKTIQGKVEKVQNKTETLNNMRETYLRERSYNNTLLKGLEEGMSLPQARRYAEFIQAEATTNFSRQTFHLANLSKTTPYLGSAINGSKSFWRLFSFDPVGVTTRIVGGYVVPTIAIMNATLGNEENKRIYRQIPEYQKDDNFVFVVNGQIFSIPVPQEIASFIRPIQTMIEKMYDANDKSGQQLLLNDLVGFSPLNLEGFINIDADRMLDENLIEDHLIPGVSKLSSQLMPPLVKSGFMLVTGTDPYTGKRVDTSYVTTDPETGESVVMDYTSGELAKGIAGLFGGNVSAPMAQAILKNLIGTNNMAILDGLTGMVASVAETGSIWRGVEDIASGIAESVTGPLTVARYGEQSNLAWNRAVTQLYREKEALLADKEYQSDLQALSRNKDMSEDARNKILSRVRTKQQEYQEKVLKASQNLITEYGGTLDKNKFASVISLMVFNDGSEQNPQNAYSSYLNSQEYQLAKAAAVETMAKMGFSSPNDSSIFGYYKQNNDGSITLEYNSPLTVLNYDLTSGQQNNMALANIRSLVSDAGLYEKHEAVEKQIQAIYGSKKKLSNSDYDAIDAIRINWNAELAKTIAPVVSQMSPENAINNKAVRDYLYTYIEVPGDWQVNDKGRYVSLGDRGNKKKAYYESWLKSMFGINDPYKGQY